MASPSATLAADEKIGFAGRVRDLPVRELLRLLCLSSRTGRLRLVDGKKYAQIDLDEGKVIRAWSLESHANLGEILCRRGLITDTVLAEAVRIQSAGPERVPLGQILLRLGFVTAEDVNEAMREQVQAAILEVVAWKSGEFTFVDTLSTAVDGIAMAVPDVLLFSGSRPGDPAARALPHGSLPGPAENGTMPGPISSQPVLCIGNASDWPALVARLAETYPGATSAAPGERLMALVERAVSSSENSAVLLDGRSLGTAAEVRMTSLIRKIHSRFPSVPVLVVHTGLTHRLRGELRRAGTSALIDLGAAGAVSVERSFPDFSEAMSVALASRRPHVLEDSCR